MYGLTFLYDAAAIAAGITVSPGWIIEVLWTSSNSRMLPTAALINVLSKKLSLFLLNKFKELPLGSVFWIFKKGFACLVFVPAIE